MPRAGIPKWEGDAMQLSRLKADFVRYRAFKGAAQRTCENYELACDQYIGYLRSWEGGRLDDDVRHFTPETVESFAEYLHVHGLIASSINLKLAALSQLGEYATKAKHNNKYILDENPVKRVERLKVAKKHERYLYKNEILALLGVDAPAEERLTLAALFYLQLRASALAGAKVKNLSLEGEQVKLEVMEKGNNPDKFTIPAEIAEPLLESLKLREAGPEDPLFVNHHGRGYNRTTLSEMVLRLAKKAGITRIPVRAHVFARHSTGSLLGQNGGSEFEIAAMLRHRDPGTAKRYVHGVNAEAARDRVRELLHG